MRSVYIWGAGNCAKLVYDTIDKECCIVKGFIDSDISKQGKVIFYSLRIYSPQVLCKSDYEYIVISTKNYQEILKTCLNMGIPRNRIVVFWMQEGTEYIRYICSLEWAVEQLHTYKIRLENLPYELGKGQKPCIKSSEELLNIVKKTGKSLCRFGDGEFEMILGRERPWFQNVDHKLAKRLREVLNTESSDVLIAVADNFGSLQHYTESAADAIRDYLYGGVRDDVIGLLDLDRVYYDAYVSRPYMIYKDKSYAKKIFSLFQEIWKNKNVLIVEGIYSRVGMGNDLLTNTKSIRRILCPAQNAFDKYEKILCAVRKEVMDNELILISLGPTATVLAYDLMKTGRQAIDIGQLDCEYEWALKEAKNKIDLLRKGVAELEGYYEPEDKSVDDAYTSEIVARIE